VRYGVSAVLLCLEILIPLGVLALRAAQERLEVDVDPFGLALAMPAWSFLLVPD
jgi:hypothetical protein